ncbi:MAG: trimeric intracellular cation channel family protein [Rhodospirillales bacterium]|nr:MAG: trimeric intracellular cation channel family protein [Rhodospirillales bacterium]
MPILFTVLDFVGVFAFGVTGGLLAVRRGLDLFGVLVLAVVTALAGGITRDVLIGDLPPAAFQDTTYLVVALAAGAACFLLHRGLGRLGHPIMVSDALGLGVFATIGCDKALRFGLDPVAAVLIGVLTAAGGGIVRDLLVAEVPRILREEIYAAAAVLAALVVVAGDALGWPPVVTAVAAIVAGFALRVLSVAFGWRLPRAPGS